MHDNVVGKAGWLMKQGQTVKSWKSRWFVLKEETISYFRGADSQQPLGHIPTEGACVRSVYVCVCLTLLDIFTVVSDEAQPSQFEIVTGTKKYYRLNIIELTIVSAGRNYLIRTQDPKDVEEWVEAIE